MIYPNKHQVQDHTQQTLKAKTMQSFNRKRKQSSNRSPLRGAWAALLIVLLVALGVPADLQGQQNLGVTGMPILGKIEHVFLDDPADPWSKGVIVVEGVPVTVPRNLLIDLPANRLTLQQLFTEAPPACLATNETGLATMDACLEGKEGGYAQILANRTSDGHLIAGDIFIARSSTGEVAGALVPTTLGGFVSYIDYTDGYMVVNGIMGEKPREAGGPANNQGVIVRLNDPDGVHSIQQGLGCDGGPNCSPDPRFTNDPENYTIVSSNGYPMCIPSTVTGIGGRTIGVSPDGTGDPFCPATNRVLGGVNNLEVPNSQRFAPFQLGDDVGGEGHWTMVDGVRFFSVHTWGIANKINTRRAPDQPDYLTIAEAEWDAPGFQNERNKSLFIGFSTLDASDVEIFTQHVDPQTGIAHEIILASIGPHNLDTIFAGEPPHAGGIFKVGFDIDFIKGAPVVAGSSACQNLLNGGYNVCPLGGTMDEEFAIVSPISREVIARSRHHAAIMPGSEPRDLRGRTASYGQYLTGVGVGHPEFVEIDLNRAETAFIFAGTPWNLDRRLGPGGCEDEDTDGACDSDQPLGALALDPFPYSEFDPRLQATLPGFTKDRVFAHYPFGENDFVPWPPQTMPAPGDMTFAFAAPPGNRCDIPNEVPVAQNDTATTNEDIPGLIVESSLLANDTDMDNDMLSCYAIDSETSQGGTITVDAGMITYFPPTDFNGQDTFRYSIRDGHGATAQAVVTIDVLPQNDPPLAKDDNFTTAMDTELTIAESSLLINDSDLDGDTVEVFSAEAVGSAGGSLTFDGTQWTYAPAAAATGIDTFNYTITDGALTSTAQIHIHVDNNSPQAIADTHTTDEDAPALIDVLANDTDSDMDVLSIASFTQAPNGSVSQNGQLILYTPSPEFFGLDQFTYTATDGKGTFSTTTVTVTINEVNDAPITHPDFAATLEDVPILVDVLSNDSDPEGEPLFVFLNPTLPGAGFEALSVEVINNQIRYVPLPNVAIEVPDMITYVVTDGVHQTPGLLAVSVSPVNDPPFAVPDVVTTMEDTPVTLSPLINDFDVENDSLRVIDITVPANFPATVNFTASTVTIDPHENFNDTSGAIQMTYTVGDGRDTTEAAITLLVMPVNDAPNAADDSLTETLEDTPVSINVLANDTDPDGDSLQMFSLTQPLLGTAGLLANGQILYVPHADANGVDTFQYSITDNLGGVSTATVTVTIIPTNDGPVASDDNLALAEDTVKRISLGTLVSNDLDLDGDVLDLVSVTQPNNGTTAIEVVNNLVEVAYTPVENYNGTDSFEYTIADPSGATSSATVSLTILPRNDAPVATDDFVSLEQSESASITISPLSNDLDIDNDVLSVSAIIIAPLHGQAEVNPNGTITYTPSAGFSGLDSITYQIQDSGSNPLTDTAVIDISVTIPVSPFSSFVRGDSNADGSLNVADPVQTLVVLFQGAAPICLVAHDSNDDESVNIGDIIFSLNYIFSSGQQPAAPFVTCGEDPTNGNLNCESHSLCD